MRDLGSGMPSLGAGRCARIILEDKVYQNPSFAGYLPILTVVFVEWRVGHNIKKQVSAACSIPYFEKASKET
jgi:hypothetical protein